MQDPNSGITFNLFPPFGTFIAFIFHTLCLLVQLPPCLHLQLPLLSADTAPAPDPASVDPQKKAICDPGHLVSSPWTPGSLSVSPGTPLYFPFVMSYFSYMDC